MRGKYEAKILNGGVEEGTNEENSRGFLPKDAARMTAEEEEKYAKRQNTEGRMSKRRERKMPSINRGAGCSVTRREDDGNLKSKGG